MARIGAPSARATLSAPDNQPSVPFGSHGIETAKAEEPLSTKAVEAAAVEGDTDAEKSVALTSAVKKVGRKTKEPPTRDRLVEAFEGKGPRRRSRRKRKAILKTIDEAGTDLRKKARIKLVRPNRQEQFKTETGQVVEGRLGKGERSRVLTAEDGSKVLLVNRRMNSRKIVEEVKAFIADTFVKSAERNSVEVTPEVLKGLFDIIGDALGPLSEVIFVQDALETATTTTPEDREIERRVQLRRSSDRRVTMRETEDERG